MGGSFPDRYRPPIESTRTTTIAETGTMSNAYAVFDKRGSLLTPSSSVVGGTPCLEMEEEELPESVSGCASEDESSSALTTRKEFAKGKKSVGFGSINIRNYAVIMGDHPCCIMGCPLTLDWSFSEGEHVSVDEYENSRSPRAARGALRFTWDERRSILSDVSDCDMRRANRKLQRQQDWKSRTRICAKFFNPSLNAATACTTNV